MAGVAAVSRLRVLSRLEEIFVPVLVGIASPLVSRKLLGAPFCLGEHENAFAHTCPTSPR